MYPARSSPPTCYLAINLEKFNKRPAEQIVKYKLNRKELLFEKTPHTPDWRNKIVKLEDGILLGVATHMLFSN